MNEIAFDPADAKAALAQLPTAAAVFALYGAETHAEPYIGRTPNLRGRLERLLQPSEKHPRRLQLAGRVRKICWRLTGSEFESLLLQFELLEKVYGTKCLERMHLGAPSFVRFLGSNAYPRLTVTNRPSQREAAWSYGPFPSRAAAERFADEALKLFLLRRCTEELAPRPDHPGCVYSEMKMCLAPCYQGCTDERYAEEAATVERFLATRGESRLVQLRAERDAASANLEFEAAAAVHAQVQRVESVRSLTAELVRPLADLRAVILQASTNPGEVAVFLYENGRLSGPVGFSIQGMKIQRDQGSEIRDQGSEIRDQGSEISTMEFETTPAAETMKGTGFSPSIHGSQEAIIKNAENPEVIGDTGGKPSAGAKAQHSLSEACGTTEVVPCYKDCPSRYISSESLSPENTPLESVPTEATTVQPAKPARAELEARMEAVLTALAANAETNSTLRQGHLALVKRWYYRPEARRAGEIFFPDADGRWPVKALLRGVGRVAASGSKSSSQERPPVEVQGIPS